MPPAIYIHLGQPKTGTTSLQRFCLRYREELKTHLSLYYPVAPEPSRHRHRHLFPFNRAHWERIRGEMASSGCARLLISNEGWFARGVSDSDLAAVRECFPGSDIFFILYLRRHDDYCKAWYNQEIKSGKIRRPGRADYYQKILEPRSGRLSPSILLRRCERQAGADRLLARIYDPALLKNGNIVDDMFSAMGMVLPEALTRERRYNPGIPHAALPYITDALLRVPKDDPLREELLRKLSFAFSRPDESGINEALLPDLEKEIELLDARYLPGYKRLFAERKCDLSFPELEADPRDVLIVDLLYSILFALREQQQSSLARRMRDFACQIVPNAAGKLAARLRERLSGPRKKA